MRDVGAAARRGPAVSSRSSVPAGQGRHEVEGDVADDDRVALLRAGLASSSSTPSRLSRSARKPDGLVVGEVGLAHPALGLDAAHDERAVVVGSRSTVKPLSSTAAGVSVTRGGSGAGSAARCSSTAAARAKPSSRRPLPRSRR
jgi:hypothetical protein